MKARWAARKAKSKGTAVGKAATPKKHGGLTAAGRKRLSEMMKKRWTERRMKAS